MKRIFASICFLLCLGLAGCSSSGNYEYPYYDMPREEKSGTFCFAFDAESVDDLESHSKIIVQGVMKDDTKEVAPYGTLYNVSTLEITKVIKGDFKVGDSINLYEMWHTENSEGKETLTIYQNYMPCEPGKEYLFFMDGFRDNDQNYTPLMFELGRYPVLSSSSTDAATLSTEELYLSNDSDTYREFYQEVITRYMQ